MPRLYLYRVLENDQDGDPWDHGAVRANDSDEVQMILTIHVRNTLDTLVEFPLKVRIYTTADDPLKAGVVATPGFIDFEVQKSG